MSEREKAWQVIHLMDVAQTYQMAKSPCHQEIDLITSNVLGNHPNTDSVLIWGAVNAAVYHYAEDIFPETIMNMNFVFKVGAVENNFIEGLGPLEYQCL